ncbi:suppressor protein of bem1/bed5 double mutants-like [Sitophilus oryzae]|uniref:Suppressor protein of bem1/bed5 double mutants-like n=1 Tax=Sitophilus oryzae TaxID=7048 RepID=A0A6J2YLL3_SITOR|nr:suppressor protein of bem1/bed5 double mutants-like [Sitophilus oryzae]
MSNNNSDLLESILQGLEENISLLKNLLYFIEKIVASKTNTITSQNGQSSEKSLTNSNEKLLNCITQPTVSGLHEIAGLKDIKRILFTLTILPRQQPQLFNNCSISNTILLYGPPGTGKTKLAHAVAAESKAVLYSVSLSDVLSSYVGETEKNIHEIFAHLKLTDKYSLLFIDEIDGVCRKRNSSENEYTRRIKTELMTHLSNINNCPNIVIIAATNRPWDLDSAILRRFRKQLYVPLPNSEDRLELLQLFTKNIPILKSIDEVIKLVELSDGLSGSDISNLIQDALNMPLMELQDTKIWRKCIDATYEPYQGTNLLIPENDLFDTENIFLCELKDMPPMSVRAREVTMSDFYEAVSNIPTTVSSEEIKKYNEFQNTFTNL